MFIEVSLQMSGIGPALGFALACSFDNIEWIGILILKKNPYRIKIISNRGENIV